MKHNLRTVVTGLCIGILAIFVIVSCRIEEVDQPSEVAAGDTITITVTISDSLVPEPNPNKGLLAILVPEDWEFVSAEYEGDLGSGVMVEVSADDEEFESDHPDSVYAAPEGMRWMLLISDEGYAYNDPIFMDVTVELKVGETEGEFALAYYLSKNNSGLQVYDGYFLSVDHMITVTGTSSVDHRIGTGIPERYSLEQNYPNPFNPSTVIRYNIPERTNVNLSVYDVTGRLIETLMDGTREAGSYEINFNANNLSSGVYIYRLEAETFSQNQRMLLVK
jgi:hypothetical protein